MLMKESEKMDLEVSLIDFSSENDNLIGNSSSPLPSWGLEEYPYSGATNIQEEMDMACKGNNDEQFPQLHESKEPEKARRKGKVNLRKSLAWDSAFFTDAGVIDAEELSSMIKGGDKQSLPMIEEDVRQSFDSISTLESDNLTLEHIEAELFGDIRASIQKVTIPSSGDVSAKTDNGSNSSAKKVDLASKDRIKPKLASKRISGAQAGIPRSQPKQITGTQRLDKGLKKDRAQVTQSISRTTSGESLSPPKISTKLQPISASKRASLDITRVKTDNDSTKTSSASVRGAQAAKASTSNKASRVLPKPTMSMKPSSVGTSPAMKIHATRSSSDSSGSTSSDKTAKSSIPVARRKVDSKPIAQPSASAKLKTLSKVALKSKLPSGNSAVSAYLMSSKINSSISPASSISDWSSISSSSATINQRSSKLRTSFDTSSCRSFDSDTSTLDLKNHLSGQTSDKPEIRGTTLPRESLKQAGTVSRPASMMKPSGLRMPSPKMGYFDGVKAVRTPNDKSNVSDNHSGAPSDITLISELSLEVHHEISGADTSKNVDVVVEESDPFELVQSAGLVASKSENQGIASALNNEEVVAEGPDTVEHVADNGLVTIKSENEIIANTLNNEEVVAEGPDTVEHVAGDGSVAIESENQRIEEVAADEPDTVEHVAGDGLVAIKSENRVILNNDTNVKSENQRIEELVADELDAVEFVAGDCLVAIKSENQVIVNNDLNVIQSETQRIEEVVAGESDAVEHAAGDGLVVIKSENQSILNNDMVAGLDTIKNIDIRTAEVTISENIRQCQTEDGDGVGVQCNDNYNLDVPSQMNEMNLEDNVNGDFKITKIDHVEREYDLTFMGDETMPQCQTGNEGRVDVKDDLDTLEETNAEINVCANHAVQLNSHVEEVSTTPFSNKVESLMNRLAYLSLNTPATAIGRMPFAVKNSSAKHFSLQDVVSCSRTRLVSAGGKGITIYSTCGRVYLMHDCFALS
ncbi:hypothetical protein K7X08_015759 [Anisodus acutangulus]|uniref:Uncharacterized protein n=1 Tax=Anisodus acutangulus TaxID=402998 RepID=A0A9Q1LES0_9SOLA|nr:hypothetical protein K7X08_015759 [Anisodus acutangulus]